MDYRVIVYRLVNTLARRSAGAGEFWRKDETMEEVIKKLLESNENLLRINSELVEVNKGWQKLATEMLNMLAEERKEKKDESN